jgi:hypothetical protein
MRRPALQEKKSNNIFMKKIINSTFYCIIMNMPVCLGLYLKNIWGDDYG